MNKAIFTLFFSINCIINSSNLETPSSQAEIHKKRAERYLSLCFSSRHCASFPLWTKLYMDEKRKQYHYDPEAGRQQNFAYRFEQWLFNIYSKSKKTLCK